MCHRLRWKIAILGLGIAGAACLVQPLRAQDDGGSGPDREWRFIERLRADGMVDVAATQLENFARDFPGDPRAASAWLEAGRIHEELGHGESATRDYEALISRFPSSPLAPEAAFRRAELLSEAKRFEDASGAYRSLLEAYPAADRADAARLGLGESLMALRQDGPARSLFRRLIAGRADPGVSARARYDLGILAERADSDSLAVVRFDSVAKLHSDQPIAAFALLRAAQLLAGREEISAARDRYLAVLDLETAPLLRGRARLGLAGLLEDRDPKMSMEQLSRLAEEGASPEQVQEALLRLGDLALRHGDSKRARRAARAFLESFADAPDAIRARLIEARADLGEQDDAPERLMRLGESTNREVAWEAMRSLGEWHFRNDRYPQAMTALRRAEGAARNDSLRAGVLLRQAEAASALSEDALAADLAQRAAELSSDDVQSGEALLLAMRSLDGSGRRATAIAVGDRLVREHPLTPAAAEGSRLLASLRRRAGHDPAAAARHLAELAAQAPTSVFARAIDIGVILRDELGDDRAALESFRASLRASEAPAERARAGVESSVTLAGQATDLGLLGKVDSARELLVEAQRTARQAAAVEGAPAWSARARRLSLGLDLALAARPDAPWLFESDSMPLLGAFGDAESEQRDRAGLRRVHQAISRALEEESTEDDRAWLIWRQAELSESAMEEREASLATALQGRISDERRHQLRYALGQLRLESGDAVGAGRELARVLEEAAATPLAMGARYGLAQAHRAQKNYSVAADLYLAFAAAYPRTLRGQRALLLAGDCALLSSDPSTAAERYRQLLNRYPDTVYRDDAYYRLGTAQHRAGKVAAARESLRRLLELRSATEYRGRALARLARIEEEAGDDSTAVVLWRELVNVDPEKARDENAGLAIGRLELGRGNFRAALQAVPDTARSQEAVALRIRAMAGSGARADALDLWENLRVQSVQASSLVPRLRCEIGEAQLEAQDLDGARESFQFTVDESREASWIARAQYRLGVMAARARDVETARREFTQAASRKPTSTWTADALYQLGTLQIREGQPDLAQKSFARVFDEFPAHPKAAAALSAEALALRRMSRFEDALERYHRLLEEFPDYDQAAQVLSNIAYCHHELQQYDVAVEAYRRVMPYLDEEDQAYAEFWIADSLAGLERYEEAAAAFLRIPYLYPDQGQLPVTAQLKAAEVYARMGNQDAAVSLYEKVLRTHGANSQWGGEAQRRLDALRGGQRGES